MLLSDVLNPLSFYLDAVDTSAWEKAESGGSIGQYDAPFMPLLAPWIIVGPILAFVALSPSAQTLVLLACMVASFALYGGVALYYYRRVQHHRRSRGTNNGR